MRRYSATLIGYYGFGNLGDELLLKACVDLLTQCGVEKSRIAVLSNNPDETAKTFGIDAFDRWKFAEILRVLRESERMIFGGGGIFQDRTSVKSCAWYWGIARLAGLMGVKVYAVGQSVGPLRLRVSKILSGNALRLCGLVHVRDEKSRVIAESLGCKNVIEGLDLVMTIKPESVSTVGKKTLVNLRPCPELEHYTEILRPHIDDDTIGAAMSQEDESALRLLGLREIVRVRNFSEAEELWCCAKRSAGMRLHFGVLSRIFRTPLAMMPYDLKVNEFAGQSGVPCITDEWKEPMMPREVPESAGDIIGVFRRLLHRL